MRDDEGEEVQDVCSKGPVKRQGLDGIEGCGENSPNKNSPSKSSPNENSPNENSPYDIVAQMRN